MELAESLSPHGQLKLIAGPNFLESELDNTVAPRLLKYTIEKSAGTIARIYRPQRTVALTSRDRSAPGFESAQRQARKLGFSPVLRSPGGRAVAYHQDSIVLNFLSQDPDPHALINERFEAICHVFIETFERLGIHSKIGEIPREYCPGKFSVVTDTVKLVGTAQRIVRGGWLIGASVVVRNAAPIREVLDNVYRALDVDMRPQTIAALNEFDSTLSVDDVITSLLKTLKNHFAILDIELTLNEELTTREPAFA